MRLVSDYHGGYRIRGSAAWRYQLHKLQHVSITVAIAGSVALQVGTISEAYPHIVLDNLGSPLGQRIRNILKHLFPVPKDDSKRVITFSNRDDFISFRCVGVTAVCDVM